jgi:L-threonylcarbamoyladenylate synthase
MNPDVPMLSEQQALLTASKILLDEEQITMAVQLLQQGQLVAFPTETVYGLGADAENVEALNRLYTVKGRPKGHPVIVHLADGKHLPDWASEIPDEAWQLANAFWPGPMTLILKRHARVPDAVTGGQETVGLRVPNHPVALQLLEAFGGGIAAPSANRFGRLSPTCATHVESDLGQDVGLILDGGHCPVGVESTIVAFKDGKPIILRPGMITAEQIEQALHAGFTPDEGSTLAPIRAPGTLVSHYAPHTPLRLLSPEELQRALLQLNPVDPTAYRIGVLTWHGLVDAGQSANLQSMVLPDEPAAYARGLYAALRDLDGHNLREIWVEAVPTSGAWAAVSDRLCRAAYREPL